MRTIRARLDCDSTTWMDDGESRARPGSSVLVVVLVSRPAGAGRVPCRADRGAKQDFFSLGSGQTHNNTNFTVVMI